MRPEPTTLIHSKRLDLRLMTPAFLAASLAGDQTQATQLLGVTIPAAWLSDAAYTQMRLDQLRRDPTFHPWLPRAIILRQEQIMIGHINFHTAPDPDYLRELAPGAVEFGYTIFPQWQGQGYATEASTALMAWAQQQGVTRFVLSISPTNAPSVQIASRLGFVKIGSHIDEEDGLEEIYERYFPQ